MKKSAIYLLAFVLIGCGGGHDSGIGAGFINICSNTQTQQTKWVNGPCPAGWVEGSINECTNIETGEIELKLMPDIDECPGGYTGGKIHDQCRGDFIVVDLEPCL